MSLSMQMSRGALALSLLGLFALLALTASPARQPTVGVLPVATSASVCDAALPHPNGWQLAQTPADLGPLAHRWDSCRA